MKNTFLCIIFVFLLTVIFPLISFTQTNKAVVTPKTVFYKRMGLEKMTPKLHLQLSIQVSKLPKANKSNKKL